MVSSCLFKLSLEILRGKLAHGRRKVIPLQCPTFVCCDSSAGITDILNANSQFGR